MSGARECAAGDQGMHVNMLRERLTPSVEDKRGTDLSTEPARVSAELQQRLGRGRKQQSIDQARVPLGQRIELMRQREHHMKIRRCNQVTPTSLKPAFLRSSLTLRAMAVPTGMIGVA